MGLSIKRVETERKARAVAERMGVGVTEAIDRVLDAALRDLTAGSSTSQEALDREALFARIRARGAGDGRSLKDIEAEMYGDRGQPV